jgi:hypothetical protein
MKRNYLDENFEDFLRHSADGLRMRPSDRVWKGISSGLKKERRGGYLLGGLLAGIAMLGYIAVERAVPSTRQVQQTAHLKSGGLHVTGQVPQTNAINSAPDQSSPEVPVVRGNSITTGGGAIVVPFRVSASAPIPVSTTTTSENTSLAFEPTVVDSYTPETTKEVAKPVSAERKNAYPMTIESIVNSYRHRSKKKITYQLYFTPTISYRKLSENKEYLRNDYSMLATPAAMNSVNNVVTHKPNLGLEVGMAAKYPVSANLKIKGGLQLNVTRYDIKAYNTSAAVATIMLNNSSRPDSVYTMSNLSNTDGYNTDWLQNFYFQISAPIGVELKLKGDDKVQFGIATTIQPTYVLGDRAYLISTDYKNYAEMPNLTRRWNVNTAFETFVGYSTGKVNWQVGPQVRYQLLSSFISKYPIKENLFDFGLRVGLSMKQ